MATKLINVAGIKLGQSVSKNSKIIHEPIPAIIEIIAPVLLALAQYNPNVSGTNSDTRLKIEDSPTSS